MTQDAAMQHPAKFVLFHVKHHPCGERVWFHVEH